MSWTWTCSKWIIASLLCFATWFHLHVTNSYLNLVCMPQHIPILPLAPSAWSHLKIFSMPVLWLKGVWRSASQNNRLPRSESDTESEQKAFVCSYSVAIKDQFKFFIPPSPICLFTTLHQAETSSKSEWTQSSFSLLSLLFQALFFQHSPRAAPPATPLAGQKPTHSCFAAQWDV